MGFWSVTNPYNTIFKQQVVATIYHDIFILSETHCKNDESIEFDNYVVFKNNRKPRVKTNRGSGGIAIAIHRTVMICHTILSVLYGVDGQIAIKLKCNETETTIGILGRYLAPESYIYGQDAEGFFNQASVL